jgi:hypothetical protein
MGNQGKTYIIKLVITLYASSTHNVSNSPTQRNINTYIYKNITNPGRYHHLQMHDEEHGKLHCNDETRLPVFIYDTLK